MPSSRWRASTSHTATNWAPRRAASSITAAPRDPVPIAPMTTFSFCDRRRGVASAAAADSRAYQSGNPAATRAAAVPCKNPRRESVPRTIGDVSCWWARTFVEAIATLAEPPVRRNTLPTGEVLLNLTSEVASVVADAKHPLKLMIGGDSLSDAAWIHDLP